MGEKAYFYSEAKYCTHRAYLTVAVDGKKVTTTIQSTGTNPKTTTREYKTKKKAWKGYLYQMGVVLRGTWKFIRFDWQEEKKNAAS